MISATVFEGLKRAEKGLKSGVFRKQNRFQPFADKGEKNNDIRIRALQHK